MKLESVMYGFVVLTLALFLIAQLLQLYSGHQLSIGKMAQSTLIRNVRWCKIITKCAWISWFILSVLAFYIDVTTATKRPSIGVMVLSYFMGLYLFHLSYSTRRERLNKPDFVKSPEKYENLETWEFEIGRASCRERVF